MVVALKGLRTRTSGLLNSKGPRRRTVQGIKAGELPRGIGEEAVKIPEPLLGLLTMFLAW